jgi:hypothetical protein
MTGKKLREHVEAGKAVYLAPGYGGWYWRIEWTNKKEILKLAQLLEDAKKRHDCGKYNTDPSDHLLITELREAAGGLDIKLEFE